MKILITDNGYLTESKDIPEIGRRYTLTGAEDGTIRQNAAFHALVKEYWKSGLHPKYGGDDYSSFRDQIKRTIGAGFESFVYAEIRGGKARIFQVKQYDQIPLSIRQDTDLKEIIQGKLKSWSDYTVKNRRETIDNLIDDMTAAGVNSAKFQEIIEGMKNDKS